MAGAARRSTTSRQLPRDYPDLKVVKLEQNYRSSVRILRSANALIGNNPKLFDKRLWSDLGTGDTIRVTPAADDEAEAESVLHRISALKFERRAKFSDFAILYRGNHQARVFETALRAQGIPYDISGGQSLSTGPKSRTSSPICGYRQRRRRSGVPARGDDAETRRRAATLARLADVSAARRESLFAAAFAADLAALVPAKQRETLHAFCMLINNLRFRAEREPAGRLLNELLAATGYEAWLTDTLDKRDADARCKSVRDFVDWLARKGDADERNLLELTQTIALITMLEGRDLEDIDAVRLSTLHAAKGLEFRHVFLVGLEEGVLPHREAIDAGDVDEERRLMYVGVTRAQQQPAPFLVPDPQARGRARCRACLRDSSPSSRRRTCVTPIRRCPPMKRHGEGRRSERLKSLKARYDVIKLLSAWRRAIDPVVRARLGRPVA